MAKICRDITEWVEEEILEPVQRRHEERKQQCEQEECNWWVLCANKIVCWLIVIVSYVVEWVIRIVGKWVTYIVCEVIVFMVGSYIFIIELGAVIVDSIKNSTCNKIGVDFPHFDINNGIYLANICNESYYNPDELNPYTSQEPYSTYENIDQEGISFIQTREHSEDSIFYDTQVYILPDLKDKQLIIVFRGSESPKDSYLNIRDWVNDFFFIKTPFDSSYFLKVHAGIYSAYLTVSDELEKQILNVLDKYDMESVCFTGHSLGGGLATIAALDSVKWLGNTVPIKCITFAAPCVGNIFFSNRFSTKIRESFRVVNAGDIVPSVPPSFWGFKHVGYEFDIPEEGLAPSSRNVDEVMYVRCHSYSNEFTNMASWVVQSREVGIEQHLLIDEKNKKGYIDRLTGYLV